MKSSKASSEDPPVRVAVVADVRCDVPRCPRTLGHLQFAVLGVLRAGSRRGSEVRGELEKLGTRKAGPAFYRLMARLEEAGLVRGWYEQEVIDGQIFRERAYEVTGEGAESWDHTRSFHTNVIGLAAGESAI